MTIRLIMLATFVIFSACSTTKYNKKSDSTSLFGNPLLPFEVFEETINYEFISNVSTDSVYTIEDDYDFELDSQYGGINAIESTELVIKNYISDQFGKLDSYADLKIKVELNELRLVKQRKLGTRFTFETKASFKYIISILRETELIYFEEVEDYTKSEVRKDKYERAVVNTINSMNDRISLKLYSIFRDCNSIDCVSKKSSNSVLK